jgi:hypothetical protein
VRRVVFGSPRKDSFLWRLRHNTARADIVAADQAQPVEALVVGQSDAVGQRCPPARLRGTVSPKGERGTTEFVRLQPEGGLTGVRTRRALCPSS